ncbi:regulatory protein RecX [Aestuariibacter sp. A3R04]|uniref:regulatory protein RecX n=1 Tax=Aestuariibacter sp. A3R04 TaxID=2841571 RepID=UPI001C0A2A90|nr:regulatory protein RecX [Aestuariibacter sp. A3R04]MBU3022245.1 recombination regulator RecX [Aestuariibacter sp. A3R04]
MSDPERKIIIDAITRMLARREHSREEVITKLTQKGFHRDAFTNIVAEFVDADVQSDLRYAQMRIRSCAAKGQGPVRIARELGQHRINDSIIHSAMAEADIDWFALATTVKEKKFGEAIEKDFKRKQKQMQFLNYRGFTQEQIQYAVKGD